ncbi:MAG: hypothetical protein GF320_08410 [Armatimonadia bacterium]|nr:hypothetical protein [Armatimonadia bacterium]
MAQTPAAPAPGAERLTDSRESLSRPSLSADGEWVAYIATGSRGPEVRVNRLAAPLPASHTLASGPAPDEILGPPVWAGDPFPLIWVTGDAHLWVLERDGTLRTRELPHPRGMRGYAYDPFRRRLIVHGPAVAYEYAIGLERDEDGRLLDLGAPNSDISWLSLGPIPGTLLYVDSGAVKVWSEGSGARTVLAPDDQVARYTAVRCGQGSLRPVAVARARGDQHPSVIVGLNWATGTEHVVEVPGRRLAAGVPAAPGWAVAEADRALWLLDLEGDATLSLTPATARDADPVVSADGKWLVFASAGREDTDLDGRVGPTDPANVYRMRLPIAIP